MEINKKTAIATVLVSFAAGFIVRDRFDSCLQAIKTLDTKLASSLGSYRWVVYAGTLVTATGAAHWFLEEEELNLLAQAVVNGIVTSEEAIEQAEDKKNTRAVQILVKQAIERGDIGVNDQLVGFADGRTLLTWAAGRGYVDVMKLVLKKGANVNARDKYGNTALVPAARTGHTQIVRLLLEQKDVDVNAKNECGCTALTEAAKGHRKEIVEALLGHPDIDVNAVRTYDGCTALILAMYYANRGRRVDIVKMLLQHKNIDVNAARKDDGTTTLILAASNKDAKIVELLLAHEKINIDATDKNGRTALRWAQDRGHTQIVTLLENASKNVKQ